MHIRGINVDCICVEQMLEKFGDYKRVIRSR